MNKQDQAEESKTDEQRRLPPGTHYYDARDGMNCKFCGLALGSYDARQPCGGVRREPSGRLPFDAAVAALRARGTKTKQIVNAETGAAIRLEELEGPWVVLE